MLGRGEGGCEIIGEIGKIRGKKGHPGRKEGERYTGMGKLMGITKFVIVKGKNPKGKQNTNAVNKEI